MKHTKEEVIAMANKLAFNLQDLDAIAMLMSYAALLGDGPVGFSAHPGTSLCGICSGSQEGVEMTTDSTGRMMLPELQKKLEWLANAAYENDMSVAADELNACAESVKFHLTPRPVTDEDVERATVAAYKMAPRGCMWEALPEESKNEWRSWIRAAIESFTQRGQLVCPSCEPDGVYSEDGTGPYDCYSCGKKAVPQRHAVAGGRKVLDVVPGVMRCAKCQFQVHRTNIYMKSGTTGPGDNKTEPCPNGCGPLWPVTWEQYATEAWDTAARYFNELKEVQALLSQRDQGGVREGWQWVPVEPTPIMLAQAYNRTYFSNDPAFEASVIYKSMLSAAPHPGDGEKGNG